MACAQVLAVFSNGRIEDFMTAKTLSPEDMRHPTFVPRIARKLRCCLGGGGGIMHLCWGTAQILAWTTRQRIAPLTPSHACVNNNAHCRELHAVSTEPAPGEKVDDKSVLDLIQVGG